MSKRRDELNRSTGAAELPREMADRFTRALNRFLAIEAATGILLVVAAGAALVLANSPWSVAFFEFWSTPLEVRFGAFDLSRSLRLWVNDALMTLFFFVVALELKRALVRGELRNLRVAAFSFAGALGGMVAPAAIYLALMYGQPGAHGWGAVTATDTAFVMGALALLGTRTPPSLRLFLLSLAIFDDLGAIIIVAVVYGDALDPNALMAAGVALAAVFGAERLGVRSVPFYVVLGVCAWLAFDASGLHPTVAGVLLGLMTPAKEWVSPERMRSIFERVLVPRVGTELDDVSSGRANLGRARVAATESVSPVERLELKLHPWTGFVVMPLFALANAGVEFTWASLRAPIGGAMVAGLVLGKPIGVLGASWIAARTGLATRPSGSRWSTLAAGSVLTGIGFTMSLFIAGLALPAESLPAAKIGILIAAVVAAGSGLLALWWTTRRSA
jgi:NhaA family Na+:H+ antiporter